MKKQEAINCLLADKEYLVDMKICDGEEMDIAIKALEEVTQYREIGTVVDIKSNMEELKRWRTDKTNLKIKNVFANTSTLICHNCDHKDEYIEELEAEIEEYRKIGTVDFEGDGYADGHLVNQITDPAEISQKEAAEQKCIKGMRRLIDADTLLEQYDLKNAVKYGNENAEQQAHSYDTLMLYEIADMIRDAPTVCYMSQVSESEK